MGHDDCTFGTDEGIEHPLETLTIVHGIFLRRQPNASASDCQADVPEGLIVQAELRLQGMQQDGGWQMIVS